LHFNLKKGLHLPLHGAPDERIDNAGEIDSVAVLGADYVGLKPTMLVQEGDSVKLGSPLFEDKKNPGVIITSPAAGTVTSINRGAKRALVSVVVATEGDAAEVFPSIEDDLAALGQDKIRSTLQQSGAWAAFRTRPYGKIPAIESSANSIFVNAMDSNPLAVDPQLIIKERASDFATGIAVLSKFDVPVYVCQAQGAELPDAAGANVHTARFSGPHPAGLSSTHVHFIDPVNLKKTVWTIGYQDVIAIGSLFLTGKVDASRMIALTGPYINSPRVFKTQLGAKVSGLLEGRTVSGDTRVISGSVLNGHVAVGDVDYLGRYDNQVTVIEEDRERQFLGWIAPGLKRFSALNVFVSSFFKPKSYEITTSQNGSPRAIVPLGVFEKVMPLDVLPSPLLKALLVKDTDSAQELGCLELVEEDLALCSFVDPGKHDFGPVLRNTLNQIEREG
jgi:Na+-transporting NADH:ubiquinone oxidoreductase subunit A